MQAAELERLIEQFPDCSLVAYADIGTGITLVSAGQSDIPREALDELCAEAALTLGKSGVPSMGATPCPVAIKALEKTVFVYVRATDEPDDALLCMCQPDIDLEGFLTAARATIDGSK
ncbi:MAG: hypothetical protein ABJQ34_07675 [Paracoccaceae bacterium]